MLRLEWARAWVRVLGVALLTMGAAQGGFAQSATTTTLAVTSGGSAVTQVKEGTVITLAAMVTVGGAAATPPGQVDFCEVKAAPLRCTDIRLLGMVQLSSAGTATLKLFPGPGTHVYQAIFLGTHIEAGSSSGPSQLVVTPYYPTVTTITSSGTPGDYTLTATVTGTQGTIPPTGTVSFLDASNGNYLLGKTTVLVPGPSKSGFNFAPVIPPTTLAYSPIVAAADFNEDGNPDMLLAEDSTIPFSGMTGGFAAPLLGNGNDTFTSTPITRIPGLTDDPPAVADFNGDGIPDIVTTTSDTGGGSNQIQVMLGRGDGTFTAMPPVLEGGGGQYYATGDFNGDGKEDFAVVDQAIGLITIWLGKGDGTFYPRSSIIPVGPSKLVNVVAGDFNNDGIPDLAVVNGGFNIPATPDMPATATIGWVTILLGKGDGTFTAAPNPFGTGYPLEFEPLDITTADLNGDGNLDLVIENKITNPPPETLLTVLLGNGDGTFKPQFPITIPNGSQSIAYGDFNGDGKVDLAIGSGGSDVSVLMGNGDGTFAPALTEATPNLPSYPVVAADFNGDGLSDIALVSGFEPALLVPELATETVTATANNIFLVGSGDQLVVASYSGDSNYQPSTSGTVELSTERVPVMLSLSANPATSYYGQQVELTATLSPDTAQQGHLPNGIVTFRNGSTVLGAVKIAGGVATWDTSTLPAGKDKLTATYSKDPNFVSSNVATITETVTGDSSTTSLTASPNPAGAGQSFNLSATVAGVGTAIVPTGTVNFYSDGTQIGSAILDATGHTTDTTPTLPVGTHVLTAVYLGDAGFSGSTSAPVTVVVNPNFTIVLSSPSVTLQTYDHTTITARLTSFGEFADNLTLSCGDLPAYVTCIFTPNPATLAADGTTTVSFYLDTDSILGGDARGGHASARNHPPESPGNRPSHRNLALLLSPVGLFAGLAARRRRRLNCRRGRLGRRITGCLLLLLALLAFPAAFFLGGCGDSIIIPVPSAAAGTYSIPITATGSASGLVRTAQLTLTVTQ